MDFEIPRKKAPFDDLMLYPFFSQREFSEDVLSTLLGEKMKVKSVRTFPLDPILHRMSNVLAIKAEGEVTGHWIVIKRIDGSLSSREARIAVRTMASLAIEGCRRESDGDFSPCVIIIDSEGATGSDELMEAETIYLDDMTLSMVIISPEEGESGFLKAYINELESGELVTPSLVSAMENIHSEEGKERLSDYWKRVEKRWKSNLGADLMALEMTKDEIVKSLGMDEDDFLNTLALSYFRNKVSTG